MFFFPHGHWASECWIMCFLQLRTFPHTTCSLARRSGNTEECASVEVRVLACFPVEVLFLSRSSRARPERKDVAFAMCTAMRCEAWTLSCELPLATLRFSACSLVCWQFGSFPLWVAAKHNAAKHWCELIMSGGALYVAVSPATSEPAKKGRAIALGRFWCTRLSSSLPSMHTYMCENPKIFKVALSLGMSPKHFQ